MTNYDETAGTEDPQFLLGELRRIIGLEDDATALAEEPAGNEAWGDQHLREVAITPPAVVLAAADLVIPPREPRPEARSRMIEAAGRALAERRKMSGLLPVLLRSVREDANLTIADVAERSELSEETLRALETGEVGVDLRLDVDTTVAWIRAVPADRPMVLAALRRSLQTGWTGDPALAAGLPDRPASVDDYIGQVVAQLDLDDKD
jgi:DNA-binding XRE family transcriptional regulator